MKIYGHQVADTAHWARMRAHAALDKRGAEFPDDPLRRLRILNEEFLELVRELSPINGKDPDYNRQQDELLDIAATALMWLAALEKEKE